MGRSEELLDETLRREVTAHLAESSDVGLYSTLSGQCRIAELFIGTLYGTAYGTRQPKTDRRPTSSRGQI